MDDSVPEAQRFAIRPQPAPALRTLAAWLRARRWSPWLIAAAGVAAVAVLGLLLAFAGVMRNAVEQGDSRRRVTAQHWESVWRCNALPGRDQRQACLAQLSLSVPGAGASTASP